MKGKNLGGLKGGGLIGLAPVPDTEEQQKLLGHPLDGPVPGFIYQLSRNPAFKRDFDPVFSFYLSSDEKAKGKMIFGGYNLNYAKSGSSDKDIFWAKQSGNPYYWGLNSDSVKFGDINLI